MFLVGETKNTYPSQLHSKRICIIEFFFRFHLLFLPPPFFLSHPLTQPYNVRIYVEVALVDFGLNVSFLVLQNKRMYLIDYIYHIIPIQSFPTFSQIWLGFFNPLLSPFLITQYNSVSA